MQVTLGDLARLVGPDRRDEGRVDVEPGAEGIDSLGDGVEVGVEGRVVGS